MSLTRGELAPLEVASRLDKLRTRFDEAGVDALIVTNLANVRYLSGFSGSAGLVVVTADGALLATDSRYRTQSAEQVEAAGVAGRLDIAIGNPDDQRGAGRAARAAPPAARAGRPRGARRRVGVPGRPGGRQRVVGRAAALAGDLRGRGGGSAVHRRRRGAARGQGRRRTGPHGEGGRHRRR